MTRAAYEDLPGDDLRWGLRVSVPRHAIRDPEHRLYLLLAGRLGDSAQG